MYQPAVPDCYFVLGVDEDASEKQIRSAYKKLALRHYPDKGARNDEVMKQVNEAYEILSDARQRYEYDSEYPTIKRKWHRYRAWIAKTKKAGESNTTCAPKAKQTNAKKPKSTPKTKAKKKTAPKKKAQKKLKAKSGSVKYETMAEDIGPQFKVIAHGVEMTVEEHAKTCGCRMYQRYKTNPEVDYSSGKEDDDEYVPDE